MLTYDIKFLSTDESIYLKSNDFNCFKYETKKRSDETIYEAGKRSFYEYRSGQWRAPCPRQIRQLEAKLRDRNIVNCEWSDSLITIIFSSGEIAYLSVTENIVDITQILFDRYFVGKLSQAISNVVLCKSMILFVHLDKTGTLVTFGKNSNSDHPCRISDREPHLQTIELAGGSRKADRHISWSENESRVLVLVWSVASLEPAPWSPVVEDCANLHLYKVSGQNMTLIAFHQLENETLTVELAYNQENVLHIVEQSACSKNGVGLHWIRYEIGACSSAIKLSSLRERITQAILAAPARSARRSACDTRLLIGCIDGTLHIVHHVAGLTHSVKTGFIASAVRWSGQLVVCADEAGRLHCFDRALSLLHNNAKCHDLKQYMRDAHRMQILATNSTKHGSYVLTTFSGGPLLLIRIMHPRLLTAWIRARRTSNAVALLRAMDWETEGTECLWAINKLVCGALRSGAEAVAEEGVAQAALGAFLAPLAPHEPRALRYAPHITDLARKFFHHLLRRGRIEKALSLAVDLGAWDLFVDARWAATRRHLAHLATEAATLAANYATQSHDSDCSNSCSRCSSGSYSDSEEETHDVATMETAPPPLPRVTIHHPQLPALVPVPRTRQEPYSTASIRPNLHQYLDKDDSIWNKELGDETKRDTRLAENFKSVNEIRSMKWTSDDVMAKCRIPSSGLASISENSTDQCNLPENITRNREDRFPTSHFRQAYQNEFQEQAPSTLYRYRINGEQQSANFKDRRFENITARDRLRTGERNKVKFSDTVTIAVMSDPPQCPEPARELAESLPLCAPHNYLAAFTPLGNNSQPHQTHHPHPHHSYQQPHQSRQAQPPGTPLDYIEV